MVLRVLLVMTMLRAQLLLILMVPQLRSPTVPQLMMPMVPQQKKNMVLQLTMMFLPQNTAMLPDADVPDLATLADLPQLGLTKTETVQLPEDQLVDDQLHKPQDVDVVEVLSPSQSLTEAHKEMPSPSDKLEN